MSWNFGWEMSWNRQPCPGISPWNFRRHPEPSSLKRLGESLIQLTATLRLEYLKQSEISRATETKHLINLLEAEVRPLMTNANLSLSSASHGLPKELPTSKQIQGLKEYMSNFMSSTALKEENRRSIIETVLSYIILFNKRRSGETASLTKDNWNDRDKWKKFASDESAKLTNEEKKLLENLELVYLKGKCNKFVPILFPRDCVHIVQWLSERTEKYIFENNRGNPIRGNDAMREVVKRAGVPCDNINSTNFRKLAATTLQLENFNDAEFRFICDHLGHTIDVHRRWYRLRDATVELVKVGGILSKDYSKSNEMDQSSEASSTGPSNVGDPKAHQTMERKCKGNEGGQHRATRSQKVTRWTPQQTEYLRMRCSQQIAFDTTLRKDEAQKIIAEMPSLLKHRTWSDVKNKVRNEAIRFARKASGH